MQTVSLYDILSKVIPGALCFFLTGAYSWAIHQKVSDVLSLFIIYLIGYVADTLAGMLERPLLFKTFTGTPSRRLLENRSFAHIKLHQLPLLDAFITEHYPDLASNKDACFQKIYSEVNKTDVPRVSSFLQAYIFSRNIFFAFMFSAPVYLWRSFSWGLLIAAAALATLFWLNSKYRAYYFSKEVIESFIREKNI